VDDATSSSEAGAGASDSASAAETWLVRVLLVVAFGLAFGIEGMTLLRSFVIDEEVDAEAQQEVTEQVPVLREGDRLLPALSSGVRVQALRLLAEEEAWTFTVRVRPDPANTAAYTLTFDRLNADNGTVDTTDQAYTWVPPDTATFTASWSLPPGRRPATLMVTGERDVASDSSATVSRTVSVRHVPVRMQRE